MRTKHLFYTAAMAALFAACVNDDFETIGQQDNVVNDGRPVVSDVKLNFTKGGADTRLSYEGQEIGYQWEATDEIGALLMDNVVADKPETESLTWLEKYELVNDIHTSYRFTYDVNNKVWGCDAKMLEGNYFFAYPWESYNGERRVKHSLTNQSQEGVEAGVRRESYAKNQFFIGYSQIMAGTEDTEVLDSSVEMVPVLGAIQLQIVNTGTQTRHINKVVLKSNHLYSTLTFDPTKAEYGTQGAWNLKNSDLRGMDEDYKWNMPENARYFNYANYTGNKEDVFSSEAKTPAYVYNIGEGDEYVRNEALRAVVKQDPTDTDQYAQITITGTDEQRALVSTKADENAIAYVLIMANEVKDITAKTADGKDGGLLMDIYTDEGIVRNIDLTVKTTDDVTKPAGQDKYQALVSSAVKVIGPSVVNTIGVQIDDNSFNVPTSMDIYTDDDLAQFIQGNVNETGAQKITANLVKPDVTLSAEMDELLAKNADVNLTITALDKDKKSNGYVLTLADGVVSNLFDLENVHINCDVKLAEGAEINLTEDSELNDIAIAVEEGATLNIAESLDSKTKGAAITNEGNVSIAENAKVPAVVEFTNKAEMEIAANADVRGKVTNNANAVVDNAGYIRGVNNAAATNEKDEDGVINLTGKGTIAGGTNDGIINAGADTRVTVEDGEGEIIIELGAKVNANADNTVAYETGDLEIDDTVLEALKATTNATIKKLILTGDVEITAEKKAAEFEIIAAQNGSSLTVGEKSALKVTNLNIEGDTETDGAITATTVTVNEDVTLNNYGDIAATDFENNGEVNNHGTVTVVNKIGGSSNDWNYNVAKDETGKLSDLQIAMNTAVTGWLNNVADNSPTHYNYNPNDVDAFAESMAVWAESEQHKFAVDLADELGLAHNSEASAWKSALKKNGVAITEFTTAVNTQILNATNVAVIKNLVIDATTGVLKYAPDTQDETNFKDSQAEAYAPLYQFLANPNNIEKSAGRLVAAAVWGISVADLETAMSKSTGKTPYLYVWKGCKLDQAIDIWKSNTNLTDGQLGTNAFTQAFNGGSAKDNILDYLVNWVRAIYSGDPDNVAIKSVQSQLKTIGVTYENVLSLFGNSTNNGYTKTQMGLCDGAIK